MFSKGLPNSFWEYGVGDNKISQIDCLAMSDWQGGALFVVYKAKNKDGMRVFSCEDFHSYGSDPEADGCFKGSEGIEYVAPALLEALDKRDEWKCRVSFGERGHYVAWSQDGIWFKKTRGVADVLDDNRQQIECLTLGVDDSFFLVAKNGKICWNLMGNYPALDAIANDLYNGGVTVRATAPTFASHELLTWTPVRRLEPFPMQRVLHPFLRRHRRLSGSILVSLAIGVCSG